MKYIFKASPLYNFLDYCNESSIANKYNGNATGL